MNIKNILAAGLMMCSTVNIVCADDWGGIERYAADNERLLSGPADPNRVVLLGNSITDNWPGQDRKFFADNNLIGRGISGHTSYQFLVRFREDVIDLKPLAVVINVATNDIAENTCPYNESRTFGNVKSMVELAEANGIKVILTSVLPTNRFGWRPSIQDVPEKIRSLNTLIRNYAQEKEIPYVDYYTLMVNPTDGAMKDGLSSDGVHPTIEGYTIMEKALIPVINNIRQEAYN